MLKLRSDQVHTLYRDDELRAFVIEMIEHLRRHQGPEVDELDDGELGGHIEAALVRAGTHGLTSRRDCARWLGLAACFGWDFDRARPWVTACLADPALGPRERLQRVFERCVQELEDEADAHVAARKQRYGI